MIPETNKVGYLPTSQAVKEWFRPINGLASRVVEFFEAVRVTRAVSKQAARYYAMNGLQLAEIGLTREQIPAALLREFERAYR